MCNFSSSTLKNVGMIGGVLNHCISFLMPQIKLQNDIKTRTVVSFVNTNGKGCGEIFTGSS